jgi:CRISPR-associated protein Cas5d
MKTYEVAVEIAGPTAMWSRPDTGATPTSYVAPTYSAAKGIFESILRWQSVDIHPLRVEICSPVVFHRYVTNYGGPLRSTSSMKSGSSHQVFATVLINVRYRLVAQVLERTRAPDGTFAPHAYQDAFARRLAAGTWFTTPSLGWKEFAPSYVGPPRPGLEPCVTENHEIPSMLHTVFDTPQTGKINPRFASNLKVTNGVLHYAQ